MIAPSRLPSALLDAFEAALPAPNEPGLAPVEIWRRVGRWALITARHAIRELVRQGRASYTGPDSRRRYRRAT
jgi:hypothetical protein